MSVSDASLFLAAGLGVVAGGQHAVYGPDHFAGLAPLAARGGRGAWRVGVSWGLGHACGAGLAAGLALLLRGALPGVEDHLSGWSDRIVGILMCVVGAVGLRAALRSGGARRTEVDAHGHHHGAHDHAAPHHAAHRHGTHEDERARSAAARHGRTTRHSAFGLGVFHGGGGLAHLFAVLPALGFPGLALPSAYLAGYACGSLAVLTVFAAIVGRLALEERPRARRGVLAAASLASLAVGLVWTIQSFA